MKFTTVLIVTVLAEVNGQYFYNQPKPEGIFSGSANLPSVQLFQSTGPLNQAGDLGQIQSLPRYPAGNFNNGQNLNYNGFQGSPSSISQAPVAQLPAPVISKNVYFHLPPPDLDSDFASIPKLPAPRKNYNIIFIKAPTRPSINTQQISQLRQGNQEKTIVYVLTNKPDEGQLIKDLTREEPKPSKPEVYFIKYKTQTNGAEREPAATNFQNGIPTQAKDNNGYIY